MRESKGLVRKRLIQFAREHDILAVYIGTDPEEDRRIYWFLVPGRHNGTLENKVSSLELNLSRETKTNVTIRIYPISPEQAGSYGFIGKEIYRK